MQQEQPKNPELLRLKEAFLRAAKLLLHWTRMAMEITSIIPLCSPKNFKASPVFLNLVQHRSTADTGQTQCGLLEHGIAGVLCRRFSKLAEPNLRYHLNYTGQA